MKELPIEKVALLFFRKGVDEPDVTMVFEEEAKSAIEHFYRNIDSHESKKVWISPEKDFSINLSEVSLIRYSEIEKDPEDENDEDEEEQDDLETGWTPED